MGLLEAHASLAGKVAAIVGGAGGIGGAVTLALARAGVDVASCDVDAEAVEAIVPEVQALGRRILSTRADVADVEALDAFYDRVEVEFDRLDVLVNVAGGVQRGLFLDTTREQNARDIRLNYGYVLDSVRRAVPLIRRGGWGGSIISFTTTEAHRGAATYAGAKAATASCPRPSAAPWPGSSPGTSEFRPAQAPSVERRAAAMIHCPLSRACS